jgi:hypothetical protein
MKNLLLAASLVALALGTTPATAQQAGCGAPPCSMTITTQGPNGKQTTTGTPIRGSNGQWSMQTQTTGQTGVKTVPQSQPRR